ncbi:hypothetical protein BD324DRAFT_629593 [Kockovaella imperatae]|uniref:Uncharacterized protein n=1 Tax=Kockovaella imperatae TaxID=4999 RepID=A0A1Y1UD38_9TREE|nr:hypothetical protein BD324DRAFT_629593 [Kockovaella imperatae]ORX35943.1 hypothetical protein BD324DRAFT_629593 [Kockovaella imperatae]
MSYTYQSRGAALQHALTLTLRRQYTCLPAEPRNVLSSSRGAGSSQEASKSPQRTYSGFEPIIRRPHEAGSGTLSGSLEMKGEVFRPRQADPVTDHLQDSDSARSIQFKSMRLDLGSEAPSDEDFPDLITSTSTGLPSNGDTDRRLAEIDHLDITRFQPSHWRIRKGHSRLRLILEFFRKLPTDTNGLVRVKAQLERLVDGLTHSAVPEGVKPGIDPSFWGRKTTYYHRTIREISALYLEVLQRLSAEHGVRAVPSCIHYFTPFIISLIKRPRLRPFKGLPNRWASMRLEQLLSRIMGLGLNLTSYQMTLIAYPMANFQELRTSTVKENRRDPHVSQARQNLHEARYLQSWDKRRETLRVMSQGSLSYDLVMQLRAEVIMSVLKDMGGLGHSFITSRPRLVQEFKLWKGMRNDEYANWISALERPDEQDDHDQPEPLSQWTFRAAMLRVVLEDRLLPKRMFSVTGSDGRQEISLAPEQLLKRMIQEYNRPTQVRDSDSVKPILYLRGAIYSIRNRHYMARRPGSLVKTVLLLADPAIQCPPLPGKIFESFLTTCHVDTQFVRMLVALCRLPAPTSPVRPHPVQLRRLSKLAGVSDSNGARVRFHPRFDNEIRAAFQGGGWTAVWKFAMERWGHEGPKDHLEADGGQIISDNPQPVARLW